MVPRPLLCNVVPRFGKVSDAATAGEREFVFNWGEADAATAVDEEREFVFSWGECSSEGEMAATVAVEGSLSGACCGGGDGRAGGEDADGKATERERFMPCVRRRGEYI